jgi:hypothetical protein
MRQEQFDDDVSDQPTIQELVDRWIEDCYGPSVRILLWYDYEPLVEETQESVEEYLGPDKHQVCIDIESHTGNGIDDQLPE